MRGLLIFLLIPILYGCGSSLGETPVLPDPLPYPAQIQSIRDGPYMLWGEWSMFIPESQDRIEVMPIRGGRFHLNALKFLEADCYNCLQIVNFKNNGDSTVDITIRIMHPFPGLPQFTGFDVKGIIMFDGSWTDEGYKYYPPWPEPFRVSWRELGDPQLLNADGYTLRWSPWYESGSDLPILNYYEGKYSSGTPTANLNGFINFYTTEDRHMFLTDGVVNRTYHVWLPPGEPVSVGYAVEACWEPPDVMPVTNPADDFPLTANQVEAYEFYFSLNNGEPITDPSCCGSDEDPSTIFMFSRQWSGHTAEHFAIYSEYYSSNGVYWYPCGDEWPDQYCEGYFNSEHFTNGNHIGVGINYNLELVPPSRTEISYTVFEFTINF